VRTGAATPRIGVTPREHNFLYSSACIAASCNRTPDGAGRSGAPRGVGEDRSPVDPERSAASAADRPQPADLIGWTPAPAGISISGGLPAICPRLLRYVNETDPPKTSWRLRGTAFRCWATQTLEERAERRRLRILNPARQLGGDWHPGSGLLLCPILHLSREQDSCPFALPPPADRGCRGVQVGTQGWSGKYLPPPVLCP
jgi:hypothetical protein